MAALYGLLIALPMIWGCAGYVLVSHPGTDETGALAVTTTMARRGE